MNEQERAADRADAEELHAEQMRRWRVRDRARMAADDRRAELWRRHRWLIITVAGLVACVVLAVACLTGWALGDVLIAITRPANPVACVPHA